jgi:hypothetical protein
MIYQSKPDNVRNFPTVALPLVLLKLMRVPLLPDRGADRAAPKNAVVLPLVSFHDSQKF